MRYPRKYSIRAQKAVETGLVDFEALVEELTDDGVPVERINELLVEDLEEGGPLFGKFFRSIEMAGDMSIGVAESQASNVAEILDLDAEIAKLAQDTRIDGRSVAELAREGDPQALELVEDTAEQQELTWICTLRRTCELCLPLHGVTLSREEWRDKGLRPRSIHPRCECDWVPAELARDRDDLIDPLVRNKVGEEKGGLRTIRGVSSRDIERSQEAVAKAMKTKQGRKMIKLLGQSGE